MSVDLHVPGFDVHVTLVNGDMTFGFDRPDEVARFLDFVLTHPEHVFTGDGMRYPCSLLRERYIDTGRVRDPLSADDLSEALREYGWLRRDDDGIERLHDRRPL